MKPFIVMILSCLLLAGCNTKPEQIGKCPQPRFTGQAPEALYSKTNPLSGTATQVREGRELYQHSVADGRIACARCHGRDGDGVGPMSHMFEPPPRNFTCAQTINGVPDGQLFWIIQNGSPGTSMPGFDSLSEEQIWQVVLYIRQLANGKFDS